MLMRLDPALAISLHIGGEALAELAADEAIMRGDADDRTGARSRIEAKIERMVVRLREATLRDFANASLASLKAF